MKYFVMAALLGAGWFAVMLIPSWTRPWLLEERALIVFNLVELMAASVIVAAIFRGAVERADRFRRRLVVATLVPLAGCVIYLTLWNVVNWTRSMSGGGLANLHDSLVLYYWGLASAVMACFVVIPYGFLCLYALQRALESEPTRAAS
jgi:hypothetical protein